MHTASFKVSVQAFGNFEMSPIGSAFLLFSCIRDRFSDDKAQFLEVCIPD